MILITGLKKNATDDLVDNYTIPYAYVTLTATLTPKLLVVGVDIGNETCVIAAAKNRGIATKKLGEKQRFLGSAVQILGMLFAHLKQMAEKNLESPVSNCVIGIPSYFTDSQRRAYLDAAHIAGLKPLRLMHDCTAITLGYGIYKTDLSNSSPTNVVFVDIGHCDTQVTVAASFEETGNQILWLLNQFYRKEQ
ncbi:hypothetical protein LXL04_030651 [Taraxacum kok-saghyz]